MPRFFVTFNFDNGQIVRYYQVNDPNIKIITENTISIDRPPKVGEERIYHGVLCLKPHLFLSISKSQIMSNGIDETEIAAIVSEYQDNEDFEHVSIKIANHTIDIPLTNNQGSIRFASIVPGKYEVKIIDKRFRVNNYIFEVIVYENSE